MDDRPAYVPLPESAFLAMLHMEDDQVALLMDLIRLYAFEGETPKGDGAAVAVFEAIRPGIDRALDNLRKKREAGRRRQGGAKCSSTTEQTPADASTSQHIGADASKTEQTPEDKEELKVNTPSPKGGEGVVGGDGAPRPRFVPPTLDEVAEYGEQFCRDRGIPPGSFDPERFHDHFASNGWRVSGRAPMRDWQASVRNWIKRDNPDMGGGGGRDIFGDYA